jgi:hypothetical protein
LPRAANDVENFARVEIHHLNGEQVLYNALPLQPLIGESGSSGQSQKKMKQALLSLFFVKKRPQIATREKGSISNSVKGGIAFTGEIKEHLRCLVSIILSMLVCNLAI